MIFKADSFKVGDSVIFSNNNGNSFTKLTKGKAYTVRNYFFRPENPDRSYLQVRNDDGFIVNPYANRFQPKSLSNSDNPLGRVYQRGYQPPPSQKPF